MLPIELEIMKNTRAHLVFITKAFFSLFEHAHNQTYDISINSVKLIKLLFLIFFIRS
jgi:hypothetical protein